MIIKLTKTSHRGREVYYRKRKFSIEEERNGTQLFCKKESTN